MLPLAIQIGYFACLICGGLLSLRFNYLLSSRHPNEFKARSGYPSENDQPAEVMRRSRLEWRYWWNREYLKLEDPEINQIGAWMRIAHYGTLALALPAAIAFFAKT